MKYFLIIFFSLFFFEKSLSEISHENFDKLFNIGKMESYNNEFTLYFKPRKKSILARGEENNYIKDYPQDLYMYNHITREEACALVKKFDGEFPEKSFNIFLDYLDINTDEFWECVDRFRQDHIWEKKNGSWKIKEQVY